MESVIEFIQFLSDFFTTGIYDFFTEVFAQLIEYFIIASIKFKIFALQFAWDVASNLLVNLGISSSLQSAWGSLDSTVLGYLTFFRLPEALNIILQALVTRFTLSFIL